MYRPLFPRANNGGLFPKSTFLIYFEKKAHMSVVWAHVSLWEHATDLVWWSYYSHLWIGRTKRSGKLRGICVSSYLEKLFCSILNQRLLEYIVSLNILHKSQIGILPSNRTADHVSLSEPWEISTFIITTKRSMLVLSISKTFLTRSGVTGSWICCCKLMLVVLFIT